MIIGGSDYGGLHHTRLKEARWLSQSSQGEFSFGQGFFGLHTDTELLLPCIDRIDCIDAVYAVYACTMTEADLNFASDLRQRRRPAPQAAGLSDLQTCGQVWQLRI